MTTKEAKMYENNIRKIKKYAKEISNPKRKKKPKKPQSSFVWVSDTEIAEMIWELGDAKFMLCKLETMETSETNEIQGRVPYNSEMVTKKVVLFPNGIMEYQNNRKLLGEIQQFIHKYVDVSEFYEKLSAYYVMFTWVYDNFNTLPYLRVLGDYGSGKTRFLQTAGSICYKPMFAGGATTPSPVFRIIEMFKGTLVLDEADFKASEDWSDIIKILNCGYQAGFPVLRTEETNGKREPKAYDCFCPKILATRREFKDKALESRCLTEKVMETSRIDIPLILDQEFFKEAQQLRNKLLLFRFRHYGKHKVDLTQQDRTIEKRLNQVIIPLYSIIEEEKAKEEIGRFLQEYNKKLIADRGEQWEALVLEEMFNIIQSRLDEERINEKLYMKTVLDCLNTKITNEKDKLSSHKIGWIIRKKLFLDVVKDRGGRWINWNNSVFFKLIKKYGVCDEVTMVTFLRGTSENVTRHKNTQLCDERYKHPVASSRTSQRHKEA